MLPPTLLYHSSDCMYIHGKEELSRQGRKLPDSCLAAALALTEIQVPRVRSAVVTSSHPSAARPSPGSDRSDLPALCLRHMTTMSCVLESTQTLSYHD